MQSLGSAWTPPQCTQHTLAKSRSSGIMLKLVVCRHAVFWHALDAVFQHAEVVSCKHWVCRAVCCISSSLMLMPLTAELGLCATIVTARPWSYGHCYCSSMWLTNLRSGYAREASKPTLYILGTSKDLQSFQAGGVHAFCLGGRLSLGRFN